MKIKRIIYLSHFTFGKRDFERFGVKIMEKNEFSIEIWDFTPFLYPEAYKTFRVPDPIDFQKHSYKLFKEMKTLKNQIESLESGVMFIFVTMPNYKMYPILRRLSRARIPYTLSITNTIPLPKKSFNNYFYSNKKSIFYIINKIKGFNLEKSKKQINKILPFKWFGIDFPEFILAGGSQTLTNYNPPVGKRTKIIWGHTLDYDLYLKDLQQPLNINLEKNKKYIVFIDGYWPYAEDYICWGIKNPTTPERYYPSLCKFFNRIEKETGFKVVIAAHPRSMYERHPDYFEGRRIIRGKTKELIRDSECVLMHTSTSICYAILYNKPVIFFVTNDIEQCNIDIDIINACCLELNKEYINIDDNYNINWEKELKIDKKSYSSYKERYIKRKGTKRKLLWQIVADEFKKVNGTRNKVLGEKAIKLRGTINN